MDEAEEYHRRAYEAHLANPSDPTLLERERHNLAFTYIEMARRLAHTGAIDDAIRRARQATALSEKTAAGEDRVVHFALLGNLLRRKGEDAARTGQWQDAINLYREAIAVHESAALDSPLLTDDYERLARIQRESGDLDGSLATLNHADALRDDLRMRPPQSLMMQRPQPLTAAFRRVAARLRVLFRRGGDRT
jgi:tetratricopeptide (TPR) repeat protein